MKTIKYFLCSLLLLLTLTGCDTEPGYEPYSDIATDAILGIRTTTEAEPVSYSENSYYVTPYGEKYHKKTCRYIREAKNGYREITETQAKRGYTACKICKP